MLNITLIAVGRMREKFYIAAFEEYAKRLNSLCTLRTVELSEMRLKPLPSDAEISSALSNEALDINKHIPTGSYLIAMCVEGKKLGSKEFSEHLEALSNAGKSRLTFVVGSSNGLHDSIKKRADLRLSMSDMTFPHHLFRVMLIEQIYRALSISAGSRYHK